VDEFNLNLPRAFDANIEDDNPTRAGFRIEL
jgi:hypothetical protein